MRRFSFSVLLVAICLLPVGIGSGTSAHSHAKAGLDGALANTASAQAQVLEDYFSRARSIDLLTAKNPAFRHFYQLPGDRADDHPAGLGERLEAGGEIGSLADHSLLLGRAFPGQPQYRVIEVQPGETPSTNGTHSEPEMAFTVQGDVDH